MRDLIISDDGCFFCRMRKSTKMISAHFVVWWSNDRTPVLRHLVGSPGTPDKQRMNLNTSWIIPILLHEIWNMRRSLSADVIRENKFVRSFMKWRTLSKLTLPNYCRPFHASQSKENGKSQACSAKRMFEDDLPISNAFPTRLQLNVKENFHVRLHPFASRFSLCSSVNDWKFNAMNSPRFSQFEVNRVFSTRKIIPFPSPLF